MIEKLSYFLLIFYMPLCLFGCTPGTLVFNGSCVVPIEQLCTGIEVISLTKNWHFVARQLRFCDKAEHPEKLTKIVFNGGESVVVARCQKFLLLDTHEWACAHKLYEGAQLVRIGGEPCTVERVYDDVGIGPVWHIDVGCPHTFFISRLCVLTHNTNCAMIIATAAEEGIISSMFAGTSLWAAAASILASWGAKVTFSGSVLTITAPLSVPLCCAAIGSATLGVIGYYAYKSIVSSLELAHSKNIIKSAERVSSEIIDTVQIGHQEIVSTTYSETDFASAQLFIPPPAFDNKPTHIIPVISPDEERQNHTLNITLHDALYRLNSLEYYALMWAAKYSQRAEACYIAKQEQNKKLQHTYELSQTVIDMLKREEINHTEYLKCYGDALQHELMNELNATLHIIDNMQSRKSVESTITRALYGNAFGMLKSAHYAIANDSVVEGAQLIDASNALLNYIAVVQAWVEAGTDAVLGTFHMMMHPIQTSKALKDVVFHVAQMLPHFIPPQPPDFCEDPPEAWEMYDQRSEEVTENWRIAANNLRTFLQQTSRPELLLIATRHAASLPMNALVTHQCHKLISTFAHCARKPLSVAYEVAQHKCSSSVWIAKASRAALRTVHELKQMVRKGKRITADMVEKLMERYLPTKLEESVVTLSNDVIAALESLPIPEPTVPTDITRVAVRVDILESIESICARLGTSLMARERAIEYFTLKAQQFGYTAEDIVSMLSCIELEAIDGCIRTLTTALREFESVPGVERVFKGILEHLKGGRLGRAKGAINELRTGLLLKYNGYTIIEFDRSLGVAGEKPIPYDLVTDKYVVEAKNIHWESTLNDPIKWKRLKDQLTRGPAHAKSIDKTYIFVTKNAIPLHLCEKVLEEFVKRGIDILQG